MNHLDDLVAALVDGELPPDRRDRALAHLATCAECRAEVDEQRRLKNMVGALGSPEVPESLNARLLSLPAMQVERRTDRVEAHAAAPVRPRGGRPPGQRHPGFARTRNRLHRPRTRLGRTAGALSALAFAFTGAVLLGGDGAGDVQPPVATFVAEHTATTGTLPLTDPAAGLVATTVSTP